LDIQLDTANDVERLAVSRFGGVFAHGCMIGSLGALYGTVKQGVRMTRGYRLVPVAWVVAAAAFGGEYVKSGASGDEISVGEGD
jgi:hypothetical protein